MNWQEELALLNDDELTRIAYAERESWGFWYNHHDRYGGQSCVLDHALNHPTTKALYYYKTILGLGISPLEQFYYKAWETTEDPLTNMSINELADFSIIEQIQNYARELLNQRKLRTEQLLEVVRK